MKRVFELTQSLHERQSEHGAVEPTLKLLTILLIEIRVLL